MIARTRLAGAVALLALCLALPAAAQGLFAGTWRPGASAELSVPLRALARPGTILPVDLIIRTDEPLEGVVRVDLGPDEEVTVRPISVGRGATHRVSVPVRMADWKARPRVTVRDSRGRYVRVDGGLVDSFASVGEGAQPRSVAVSLSGEFDGEALHVAIMGEDPLGWTTLREIDGSALIDGHPAAVGGSRRVAVATLLPTEVPASWYGWDSVDVVVWRSPDPAALSPEQASALLGFVARGGTLVVSLDARYAAFGSSPFSRAAGASFQGAEPWPVLDALAMRVRPRRPGPATGAELVLVGAAPDPGTEVPLGVGGHPLVLERALGGGRVLTLTFDVGAAQIRERIGRERLWRTLLGAEEPLDALLGEDGELRLDEHGVAPIAPVQSRRWNDLSPSGWRTTLYEALEDFEGLNPLPIAFLVVFGLLYLLCIGPIDYVLVRRLKRPALTWVTFPAAALGFSLAAVLVVALGRTEGSSLRCLEVIDEVPELELARGSTYCSLWASGRDDLALVPGPVAGWVRPAPELDEWGYYGGDVETFEDLRAVSDGLGVASRLRTAPWSLTRFDGGWIAAGGARATLGFERGGDGVHPLLHVDRSGARPWILADQRQETLAAAAGRIPVVTNHSPHRLEQAWLVLGDRAWPLGALAPGAAASAPDADGRQWAAAHHGRYGGDIFELAAAPPGSAHREVTTRGPMLMGWVEPRNPPRVEGDVELEPVTQALIRIPLTIDRGGLR